MVARRDTVGGVAFLIINITTEMAKKKQENTTSIGFEEVIWRAADKLRGNLNASEYEGVVLCAVRSIDDIKAQDFILTPGRYVGIAEQEDDGEPFEDKMKRLTSELSGLFEQSHRLEEEIRKQLGSIGFNV